LEDVFDELEKVMKSFASKEEALAITESTTINSLARKEVMKALGARRYRFYAREDERTCEHCGSLHGLVFPIAQFEVGVTASPVHPRCRCWEVPIID
jgi:SPP1 gp7 family putative phage head morphogenesis protein